MKTKIIKTYNLNCMFHIRKDLISFLKYKEIKSFSKYNIVLTEHSVKAIYDEKYLNNFEKVEVSKLFIDLIIKNKNKLFIFEIVGENNFENKKFYIKKIGLKFKYKGLYINFIVRKIKHNNKIYYKIITVWCNKINDKHQTLKNKNFFRKNSIEFSKEKINNFLFDFS